MTELRFLSFHYRLDIERAIFSYASAASLHLFGFSPAELLDNDFFNTLVVEEDRSVLKSKIFLCSKSPDIQRITYRIITKEGVVKRIADHFIGVTNTEGVIIAIEGEMMEAVNQDSSDELKAYREAIDINTIVSVTDKKGTILYANDKFCQISKYTREELIGQNHRIVNSGHHTRAFFVNLWKTIGSGQPWHGDVLNKAKDGSLYWVDSVIIPMFDDDNKIIRFLSLRHLITDRKNAEKRIANYINALEEMAFMVSHGFRGPVCNILGLVNLMANYKEYIKQDDKEVLSHLMNTCDKLEHLTDQLSGIINKCESAMYLERKDSSTPWYQVRNSAKHQLTNTPIKMDLLKDDHS